LTLELLLRANVAEKAPFALPVKVIVQSLGNLFDAQHTNSRSSQFNGQRDTVQLPAHPSHSRCVLLAQRKVGPRRLGALDEQLDGFARTL